VVRTGTGERPRPRVGRQGRGRGLHRRLPPGARGRHVLSFTVSDDDPTRFVDDATESAWNLLGEAVDGELASTQLDAVARDDTFWFVWFAFQPDTRIHGTGRPDG
jgi:hypothetical protein